MASMDSSSELPVGGNGGANSMSLQLQVPQMAEQIDPALQTHRAYVEEWTESLPFADPLGAFRALFDRVNAYNHAPIKASCGRS